MAYRAWFGSLLGAGGRPAASPFAGQAAAPGPRAGGDRLAEEPLGIRPFQKIYLNGPHNMIYDQLARPHISGPKKSLWENP